MSEQGNQQPEQNRPGGRERPHWDPAEASDDIPAPEVVQDEGQPARAEMLRDGPRIWVGSLADYNNGTLHGEWLDAAVEDDELHTAVRGMLAASQEVDAEEYGIFDYDNFGPFKVNEYEPLEHVARVARGISEHGPAFAAWAELHDGDPAMLEQFEDAFLGEYDSPAAWGHEVLLEGDLVRTLDAVVPEPLRPYIRIDDAGWARDAELSGDIHIEPAGNGRVWIFAIL